MNMLADTMTDLHFLSGVDGDIQIPRQPFFYEYDLSLLSDDYFVMQTTQTTLKEMWRLIVLNPENKTTWAAYDPDDRFTPFLKMDFWECFINHFFCASLNYWGIEVECDNDTMLKIEDNIGFKSSFRTGKDGWFNRLCFGVEIKTSVMINDRPVIFNDEDYQPFFSSRDTFAERFQALMFDLNDLDCDPPMNFAATESPYS
jgi:hypothetical protein